jgi:ligand-binding sensor domain-containing protein/serine phosphatase RsbU (regulator of sigma subunit)
MNSTGNAIKKLLVLSILTVCPLLFDISGYTQVNNPELKKEDIRFAKISTEQGLSNASVSCVIQDNKGFLWIGTSDGLNKFDGYNIIRYHYIPDNPNSISGNGIHAILEDHEGKLWIGTRAGLNKFDPQTEKFTLYEYDPKDPQSLSHNNVMSIFEDRSGTLWVGTWGGGLSKLVTPASDSPEGKNGRYSPAFIHFTHDPTDTGSLSGNFITSIAEDSNGILWIGTSGGGLNKMIPAVSEIAEDPLPGNPETKPGSRGKSHPTFIHYMNSPGDPESLSDNIVQSIFEDHSGILWVGTNNGLNRFNAETEKFTIYNIKSPENLSHNNIRAIFEDSRGTLWVGTWGGGLNRLVLPDRYFSGGRCENSSPVFIHFKHDPQNSASLSGNSVTSIIEDRSGILWIGTGDGGGLNKFDPKIKTITAYKHDPLDPESLSHNAVRSIIEDKSGIIWIGTGRDGGLNKFNPATGKFSVYKNDPADEESLSENHVMSLLEVKPGKLWVGTGNGLNEFDVKTGKFKLYPESLSGYYIISLLGDKSGNIWIGAAPAGLCKFNPETEELTIYKNDPKDPYSLSHNIVISLFEDRKGMIWIGTESGWLNKFDPGTGEFIGYRHDPDDPNSISHNTVISIFEDRSGTLWFGTGGGGLNKLVRATTDPDTSNDNNVASVKFTRYTTEDGLPNNTIYGLLEDDEGNIWISTGIGISRFNPVTEEFKNYSILENLLQDDEFHGPTVLKCISGEMYFGGINGFVKFSPGVINTIKDNSFIPPVVITKFSLFNKSVSTGENSPLEYAISETGKIELKYNQNFLSFEFSALSYTDPERNQYKYKMEGLDKDWVYSGTRRFAEYRNVKPGKYVFRVQGSNNDGKWNEKGTSLAIIISPPWWKTKLAFVFYILAFISVIYGYIKFRERKLKKDKKILEKKVRERTEEIVKQKNEIQWKNEELTRRNEEIETQRDEIERQRDLVADQRDQLVKQKVSITKSIEYASQIQNALLPPEDFVKHIFTKYFILFKPRDIVGGDFYWMNLKNNKIIFAVADCTGHGVPGALMSMLGGVLLNEVVDKIIILRANEILNELKEQIIKVLHQSGQADEAKTGMDISLCILNTENNELQFSGAFNPLYLIRNSELMEIKADMMPVGLHFKAGESFTNHTIHIQRGDTIYLFSDGYPDQFGGPDGKKFNYLQFKKLLLSIQDNIMTDQKNILEYTLESWMGNNDKNGNSYSQIDDILVMGIRF